MSLNKKSLLINILLLIILTIFHPGVSLCSAQGHSLCLQIVKEPDHTVLLELPIKKGDYFYIDYTHSSDLTPVHDVFQIDDRGMIVLIEEDYEWYGAGLEFHSQAEATISFSDKTTRVYLHRVFPHFLLRVGRVANHVFIYKEHTIPLKNLAAGGSLVWIRVISK